MDRFNEVVQYYGLAATTILFYEYFMMLPDEAGASFWRPFVMSGLTPLP